MSFSHEKFVLEDFGGKNKKIPAYEVLSSITKGYSDNGKKHYEYSDYIQEGKEFLEDAKAKVDEIKKNAFDEGYKKGLEEGFQKADNETRAKVEEFSGNLDEILSSIESFWVSMVEANREGIMRLIVETLKVIVCGEVKTNPDVILNVLKKVFKKAKDCQKMVLWINPEDLGILTEHKKDILGILGKGKKVSISMDSELQRGGCRIEVENQGIEAGIETMVKEMEKNLLGEFL